ncbi:MAG: putative sulfate exporter family transporter [Steroidobacteraceae bacterium]|nr:putative sulfate exporter family transporter [Nevskiaceae bacterium]MCP5338968.1 putative sulfate exporter family transporter [Nevskiaceae bacterium]MCP5359619.1 putative sulfate exporter family transporter [Nevskiaceae bacterium]MCP5472587.1 putative sulfate exporter family transporter [Nevskiaceae bacterium]
MGESAVSSPKASLRLLASGVLLAMGLAIAAILISRALRAWSNPAGPSPVSPVLCAVLLGVLWRNVLGAQERFLPGLKWIIDNLLRVGIALVGLRLALDGLLSTVGLAIPVVVACMATALGVSFLVGRLLGLSQPLRLLLAAGTAICGCTAVVAVTPVVHARPAETGLALTCIVVLGCAGMLLYPWLAHTVFHGSIEASAVFLGTAIHDTSQVIGASLIYAQQFGAPELVPVAGLTKMLRNLSLLALVPLFAWMASDHSGAGNVRRSQVLPTFLIAFLLLAVLRTGGDALLFGTAFQAYWDRAIEIGLGASDFFLACGMTAVGTSVVLRDLRGVGAKVIGAALIVALAVALCSMTVIHLLRGSWS